MQQFTIHLSFPSFIKYAALIGFCFGVSMAPIIILFGYGQVGFFVIPMAVIMSPLVGTIGGFFTGLVGYPVYSWLSRGIGFESRGNLYLHAQ